MQRISYCHRLQLICILFLTVSGAQSDQPIALFSSGKLDAWSKRLFVGETNYSLVMQDDGYVLKADSQQSASVLYQKAKIDLNKTPYINWRWKIENILGSANEQSKDGDDYPARVYAIIAPELFELEPRALNYAWSSNSPEGSVWKNAYSDQVVMLALRSGDKMANQWVKEKRNLKVDLKKYFNEDIQYLDGFAIMTDTDNTKSSAVSYYGNIYFTEH